SPANVSTPVTVGDRSLPPLSGNIPIGRTATLAAGAPCGRKRSVTPVVERGRRGRVGGAVLDAAETLFPGYFALTMATGVVSIACALLGMKGAAWALLAVNWIAYPTLWGLTFVRVAAFPAQIARDISDHQRAPGFFTLVAGTSVLGTQNMVVAQAQSLATALWWFGLA